MRLLILGGTKFAGRHIAHEALRRGHELTLLHRGLTDPGAVPEAEHVIGDREHDLDRLAGRAFDWVIDTSGYLPRLVRLAVATIDADRWCFVSSVSAYADFSQTVTEESLLLEPQWTSEDVGEHYGELKVACEHVVKQAYGERALIVRPGLIVGPNDASGRFSYWPHRIARGGEVLAPGAPDAPTQVVDARDLAVWMLDQIDAGTAGTFNAVSPPTTIGTVLDACTKVTGSDAQLRWAPDSFLREHDVGGWDEMPLWVSGPDAVGMTDVRPARVPSRPIEDTIADVLASPPVAGGAALTAGREAELLRQFGFGQPQSREG